MAHAQPRAELLSDGWLLAAQRRLRHDAGAFECVRVNASEYQKIIAHFNPHAYRKISQNKITEKAILELFGIPSSKLLGVLDAQFGCDRQQNPLSSAQDLERFAVEIHDGRICLKAVEGWGGYSFVGVAIERDGNHAIFRDLLSGERMSAKQLWSRTAGNGRGNAYVIERFLEQHPWFAAIHPASINTFRIWVRRQPDGVRAILAYLRIGRGGSLVDNQSSGGIVAPIDVVTGQLDAAIDGRATRHRFECHPDTGTKIAGATAPHYEQSLRLAERALTVFPRLNFAGVDVAVTPDGPIVIELNLSPDREGAAFVDVATGKLLGHPKTLTMSAMGRKRTSLDASSAR